MIAFDLSITLSHDFRSHFFHSSLFSVFSVLKIFLYAMPRRTSSLSTIASETSFIDLRRWRLCRWMVR